MEKLADGINSIIYLFNLAKEELMVMGGQALEYVKGDPSVAFGVAGAAFAILVIILIMKYFK